MIWPVMLVVIVLCGIIHSWIKKDMFDAFGWWIVSLFGGMGLLIGTGGATYAVIEYQTMLVRLDRNMVVANEQYVQQMEIVKHYAEQYPIEEKLLRDLQPDILLKLPEIKSDKFLIAQIEIACGYRDKLFKLEYQRNAYKQALDFHQRRWFSPTLASPKY